MYRIGEQLPGGEDQPEGEQEQLQWVTKRLSADDLAQWEQHCQEEEAEIEAAANALLESKTWDTETKPKRKYLRHRRRRLQAAHNEEDDLQGMLQVGTNQLVTSPTTNPLDFDEVNFMAMGRADSEHEDELANAMPM